MKIERDPKFGVNFQLFTSDSYAEYLSGQITKIHKFQQNVMTCVTNEMKNRLEKYQNAFRTLKKQHMTDKVALDTAKSELAAWHKDRKKLLDENKQLREQNQKLQQDVTVLKSKLIDERHSSGGPARKRQSGQRGAPYAPEWPDMSAPNQRLTIAALDQPTPQSRMSCATYVPPFPGKKTEDRTPLTLTHMRNSAGASRMSIDSFHFH